MGNIPGMNGPNAEKGRVIVWENVVRCDSCRSRETPDGRTYAASGRRIAIDGPREVLPSTMIRVLFMRRTILPLARTDVKHKKKQAVLSDGL